MDHPATAEGTPAHSAAHSATHCAAHSEGVLDGETVGLSASGRLGRPPAGGVADHPPDDSPDILADPPADSPSHAQPFFQRRPHAQPLSRRRSFA
ncbi:hypothetical protein [Microbispora sp. H13382]|uniref:hypothetical protein n=1 Tax=Microbispora sp. H13382 TaxID=2729112 RepID=UPI0016037373|nr:hypothetical protein [Microbispora sp. H13382]